MICRSLLKSMMLAQVVHYLRNVQIVMAMGTAWLLNYLSDVFVRLDGLGPTVIDVSIFTYNIT